MSADGLSSLSAVNSAPELKAVELEKVLMKQEEERTAAVSTVSIVDLLCF